jgi:hypothetical protein
MNENRKRTFDEMMNDQNPDEMMNKNSLENSATKPLELVRKKNFSAFAHELKKCSYQPIDFHETFRDKNDNNAEKSIFSCLAINEKWELLELAKKYALQNPAETLSYINVESDIQVYEMDEDIYYVAIYIVEPLDKFPFVDLFGDDRSQKDFNNIFAFKLKEFLSTSKSDFVADLSKHVDLYKEKMDIKSLNHELGGWPEIKIQIYADDTEENCYKFRYMLLKFLNREKMFTDSKKNELLTHGFFSEIEKNNVSHKMPVVLKKMVNVRLG